MGGGALGYTPCWPTLLIYFNLGTTGEGAIYIYYNVAVAQPMVIFRTIARHYNILNILYEYS